MKCPNCGAEIGNNNYCEFCGSQITADMQKEHDQLNKSGCPKCGSLNIQFAREKQGEIKGKNGTQIVRSTTGLCNDCGYTWQIQDETNQNKNKRKTWLWILGWFFMFPVPLTILLLRKKDMNNIVKYGIIAAVWIFYLVLGFSGRDSDKNTNSNTVTPTDSAVVSTMSNSDKIDVSLKVEPNVNEEDGSVLFGVTTNLPEGTAFVVTVKNEDYSAQDTAVVSATGTGYTSEFSDNGKALKGVYTVTVSMDLPKLQKEEVQKIIGQNGENITGKYVHQSDADSANVVSGDFEFTF